MLSAFPSPSSCGASRCTLTSADLFCAGQQSIFIKVYMITSHMLPCWTSDICLSDNCCTLWQNICLKRVLGTENPWFAIFDRLHSSLLVTLLALLMCLPHLTAAAQLNIDCLLSSRSWQLITCFAQLISTSAKLQSSSVVSAQFSWESNQLHQSDTFP